MIRATWALLTLSLALGCGGDSIGENDNSTECTPEAFRCAGDDIQRCKIDGSDWEYYRTCGATEACEMGMCQSTTSCGDGSCDPDEDCNSCAADCGCTGTNVCSTQAVCEPCPDDDGDGVCNATDACPGAGDELLIEEFLVPSDWTTPVGTAITGGEAVFTLDTEAEITRNADACMTVVPSGSSVGADLRLKFGQTSSAPPGDVTLSLGGAPLLRRDTNEIFRNAAEDVYTTYTACAGEAFYPGAQSVGVSVSPFGSDGSISIDRIAFSENPPLCPPVGVVLNGDFEEATGWSTFSGSIPIETDPTVGSDALHMNFPAGCGGGTDNIVSGRINVPLAATMPNAAVRLMLHGDLSGTSNPFNIRLEYGDTQSDLANLTTLPASSTEQTLCIPDGARGHAGYIVFSIGINCADDFRDMWVDDIEIVSDAVACP